MSPRALAIPHALTPEEVAALIRVGENLANISERLTAMMGRNGGPLAGELRAFVHEVFVTLDRLDGDPELEEGGDLEPNLAGSHTDREQDLCDEEPDDPPEANRQPVRLDVALARKEARHG